MAVGVALLDVAVDVESDGADREAFRRPARQPADRAGVRIEVEQRDVAFGGGVELQYVGDGEARLERGEDVGPQSVADRHADAMGAIAVARRRVVEVAAQFADIDEHRAVAPGRVVPELVGRESLANVARAADRQRDSDGDDAAVGVIHRQTIVHSVLGARVGGGGESVHDAQSARVGDARRLRQAGGAGGVDEQRRVLDRQRRPLVRAERGAGEIFDLKIDALLAARRRAIGEDGRRRVELGEAGGELRQEMRFDDRRLGGDDGERMGERGAGKVGVDQRRRHAGARHAEPDRDIFRAVGHHQADRVALAEPLRAGPARVAVGARVELAVGERLGFAEQRRPVTEGLGPAIKIVAERQIAVLALRRSPPWRRRWRSNGRARGRRDWC